MSRARDLHRKCIIIDGHNDHLVGKYKRYGRYDFTKVDPAFTADAPRLLKGGMTASLFMVGGHTLHRSLPLIELAHREIEEHPELLMPVTKAADIRRAKRAGKLGMMLSWESGTALENSLDILHAAYRLGVRVSTLTHNEGGTEYALQGSPSPFCYCSDSERDMFRRSSLGLTPFGREVVAEMNRIGMLIDLAHANDATVFEVVEMTEKPVISSHGGVFECCPHTRCSTDEQIRAIAATGGLLSIAFYANFLARSPDPATVDMIVDQIVYAADRAGIDHVGIGSDYDGCDPVVLLPEKLGMLTSAMIRRGLSDADIRKVWGGNYLRVLKATVG